MWELLFLIVIVSNSASQSLTCDESNVVDITNGIHLPNNDIYYDGHTYIPSEYVNNNGTITSCICLKETCILKCCPLGLGYNSKRKVCEEIEEPFNIQIVDEYLRIQSQNISEYFHFEYHKPKCLENEIRIRLKDVYNKRIEVRSDGQLYIEDESTIPPWMLLGPDKYCIDTFIKEDYVGNKETSFDAVVCLTKEKEEEHYAFSSTCMIISCVFILATVAVYGWLPELRNLHGRVLMAYLLCLFVGFIGMATMQIMLQLDNIAVETCVGLTIMIYFSLLAAFFWLNVMCFDIWWTFSGKRGMIVENMSVQAKFTAYSIYAFGFPSALTILMVSLEFSGLQPHPLLPMLRLQGCFLAGKSKLLYLYGPIVILWFANMAFFVMTAVKIASIKKEVSALKRKESARHDKQSKERQRFLLYIKLFIVMGINWLLEVISGLYPKADYIWRFVDAYNVLIGLIIFIIFVCKRKILGLMKKRYLLRRGVQQTKSISSTRTVSIRDEIDLNIRNEEKISSNN